MRSLLKKDVSRNIPLIYLFNFLGDFKFSAPVLILYLQYRTGSLASAMSLMAILMIGAALFEVPTGAIADIMGRKKTLLASGLLGLLHTVVITLGSNYFILLIGMLIGSLGMALWSGTDTALLYDSLKELNRENEYKKIRGSSSSLFAVALGIGSLLGGFIGSYSLVLTIWLNLIPQVLFFLTTLQFIEPNYHKPDSNNIYSHMKDATKVVLLNKPLLLLIIISALFFGIGEAKHIITPAWYQMNIPIEYIGIAFAFIYALSALGSFSSHIISKKLGDKFTLLLSTGYVVVATLIATVLIGPPVVAIAASTSYFFGIRGPILGALTNELVESHQRATVNSLGSFLQQILYGVYAPIMGIFADYFGIVKSVQFSTILLSINVFLIYIFFSTSHKES